MTTTAQSGVMDAINREARSAVAAGLAGASAGLLVAGVGGRIAMRVSMLIASGNVERRLTEGGNRIGEFTVDGTIALLLFGGLLTGLVGGVFWFAVRPTVRALGRGELPAAAVAAVALGGFLIIDPENRDFEILEPAWAQVVLFLVLAALTGLATALFDRFFERVLPSRTGAVLVYLVLLAMGGLFLIPAFGSLLSREFCFCADPPVVTGVVLLVAFALVVATAGWRIVRSEAPPPSWMTLGSRIAASGAVVAGLVQLTQRVIETI